MPPPARPLGFDYFKLEESETRELQREALEDHPRPDKNQAVLKTHQT